MICSSTPRIDGSFAGSHFTSWGMYGWMKATRASGGAPTAAWTQTAVAAVGGGVAGDHFGSAVGLSGTTAIAGAPAERVTPFGWGRVPSMTVASLEPGARRYRRVAA